MTDPDRRPSDLVTADSLRVVEHEYDLETPASIAVVEAICTLEDVDPLQLPAESRFVLHEHIDSAALDSLLGDGTGDGTTTISFDIVLEDTYAVDISDDGRILVLRDRLA